MPKSTATATARTHISVSSGSTRMIMIFPSSGEEQTLRFLSHMSYLIKQVPNINTVKRSCPYSNTKECKRQRKNPGTRMVPGMDPSNPTALTEMTYKDLLRYHGNFRDTNRVWKSSARV